VRALRWLLVPIVVVPVVLLLLHGFSRDPAAIPSALIGKPMPSFSLVTLDGRTVTAAELRGKPVVLNFWASWCPSCVDEHAALLDAAQHYGTSVQIVGVLYQDTPEGARSFEARHGEPSWPTLLDPNGSLAIDLGVSGPPESYVIDANGIVRYKQFGPLTQQVIADQVGRVLSTAAAGRGN
jgi:cytochrome c biogenesis protein CcmG/thiol:disulfide interchange protein DsbE